MSTSLLLAIVTTAGVAAGVFVDPSITDDAPWAIALFILASFVAAARGMINAARWAVTLGFFPIAVVMGSAAEQQAMNPPLRQFLEDRIGGFSIGSIGIQRHEMPLEIEGRLLSDAFATEAGASMRVRVDRVSAGACLEPAVGGVSLTVVGGLTAGALEQWRAGRTIRTMAVLRRPAKYLNDGVPDQERVLARRGIALVGSVKSAALVQIVQQGSWIDETAAAIRASVRHAIERHVAGRDPQSAAVAVAILIGDRGALDPLVEQRLQEAGTYHVIAISGGNIAILAGLAIGLLWAIGIRGGWAAGAAIVLLAAYAYLAGGGASVVRATVMASIYLSLRTIDQRTAPLHAISITVVAVLMASPLSIADVGLWLTFGATAALVAGAAIVRLPQSVWLRAPAALLLASLAAEVVLIPIAALVFQRVTFAGLAVNLAAIPCMAVVQIAAMVTTAADSLGAVTVAGFAGWITHSGVRGLLESARLVDLAPWLTWRVPSPANAVILAYYFALVAALLLKKRVLPAAIAAGMLMWMVVAPPTLSRAFGDGRLRLTMMDVGQGDAMLVTLPNGRTLMVDAGGVSLSGEFDIGDRVLGPALRQRGIGRLDYLAITHGHPDHIGGALSLVRDFAPSEIWYGTYVNNDDPAAKLQHMALRKGAAWRWLQTGDRLELGGVELRVHHPPIADWQRQKVRNDDSLVIELRYGQVSMLLTGDIGREVEQALIPTLELLPLVVLKAAHHGSATSSAEQFIQKLKPRLIVIGVGRANPYGHPVPDVLERYLHAGSRVLRTDLDGQLEIVTDGHHLDVTTFVNTKDTKGTKEFDLRVLGAKQVPGAQ